MSKSRPLLPTITSSVGMLVGGLLGLVGGYFLGSETGVMICFILGFLVGSISGANFGWRWHHRREQSKTC